MHCASDLFDSMCNKAFTTNLPPLIFNFTVKTTFFVAFRMMEEFKQKNPILF